MLVILFIFAVGLAPAFISACLSLQAERQAKQGQPQGLSASLGQGVLKLLDSDGDADLHYIDGLGYMVGDITCDLNARSPYLRCAINPMGPCDGCSAYAPKVFERQF
ncbi:MAG: DUF6464 family protein [Nodosilinea sp.]